MDHRISLSMLLNCNRMDWTKYLCVLCKFIPHDAVKARCGYWLCFECSMQLLSQPMPLCPQDECRKPLADHVGPLFAPDRFLRDEISRLDVACVNRSKGCTWCGKVNDFYHHLNSCCYNRVASEHCPNCSASDEHRAHFHSYPQAQIANLETRLNGFLCAQRRLEQAVTRLEEAITRLEEKYNRESSEIDDMMVLVHLPEY